MVLQLWLPSEVDPDGVYTQLLLNLCPLVLYSPGTTCSSWPWQLGLEEVLAIL